MDTRASGVGPSRPTSRAARGGWLALVAVALAGIGGGALLGAAWASPRAPAKRGRPRRPRGSRPAAAGGEKGQLDAQAPRQEVDRGTDGDMDGLPTGELRRPGAAGIGAPSLLDELPYVDLVVTDAPGHRNHDRRHALPARPSGPD